MDSVPTTSATLPQTYSEMNPGSIDEIAVYFMSYLHNLAGHVDIEVNAVFRDHCYARPWNWRPESIYVKPTKRIFFTSNSSHSRNKLNSDGRIDVESMETTSNEAFQRCREFCNNSCHHREELQKLLNLVRPTDVDDWEEKIDKAFWSVAQSSLFDQALQILTTEHLSRLVKNSSSIELTSRIISIDSASKKFRHVFASTGYDWKLIQWLLSLLFDNLPKDYLIIYLEILQNLRRKIPQLVDRILSTQPRILTKSNTSINWDSIAPLLKRNYNPITVCLNASRSRKLPGNPILIIAPSTTSNQISSRQLKWISSLGQLSTVVHVNSHFGLAANKINMTSCADQLVQVTATKIQEVRTDCPGRPLILVGFNTGAALACQIAHIEPVTAIISLGFPFSTADGPRGTPDDILMDVRSPVMFVIGQNATTARIDDIEEMRQRMLVQTSLVVVGSADDQLRISTMKKYSQGITQSMVDRYIIDEIGDFIGAILMQPHPLPLRHTAIMNYDKNYHKKDSRRRKASNSNSIVNLDAHSAGVGKKSRPPTPTVISPLVGQNSGGKRWVNLHMPQKFTLMTKQMANSSLRKKCDAKSESKSVNFSNNFPKIDAGEGTSHFPASQISTDGGITLNIGSLASLGPMGPIRLTPNTQEMSKSLKLPKATHIRAIHPAANAKSSTRFVTHPATDLSQKPSDPESKKIIINQLVAEQGNQDDAMGNQINATNEKASEVIKTGEKSTTPISPATMTGDEHKKFKQQVKDPIKDFENILDIPIIFAKDDGTLSGLGKSDESTGELINELKNTKTIETKAQKQQYHIISSKGMQNLSFLNVDNLSSETFKHTRIIFTKDNSIINSKIPATINLIHKKKINNN